MLCRTRPRDRPRRGIAAVELAVLLPLLGFILVAAIDYARLFYYSVTLANCARNGALYGCRSTFDPTSPYTSLQAAALADASNVQPAPVITSSNGVDGSGQAFIKVTASYPFQTIASYPGIPSEITLQQTVTLPINPTSPQGQ